MAFLVSMLGTLVTLVCAVLLLRQYAATRLPLLLWSGLCFLGLTASNMLLCLDMTHDSVATLYIPRLATAAIAMSLLLVGLIWESEQP